MRVLHYTTPVHLALILREGQVRATAHEGFRTPMVSLVADGGPAPLFWWAVGSPHPFCDRTTARLVLDVPDNALQPWVAACSSPALVRTTKRKGDAIKQWLVHHGPLPGTCIVRAEVLVGGQWLTTTLPALEAMLQGFRVTIRSVVTGGQQHVQF